MTTASPDHGEHGLGALAGLRVVELGVWVAAPATAALLADWGADVVKVEPPGGDPMRGVFGSLGIDDDMPNPAFALDNRGKRSVFFTGLEAARHIPAVCRALGRPDLLDDPRFADAKAIRRHRTEVITTLDEIIAERPLAEWAERFEREGVWWAPAQTPADVVQDPQLAANDGFVDLDGGALRSVNGPVTFSGLPATQGAHVPALGEHTDEVLAELAGRASDTAGAGLAP